MESKQVSNVNTDQPLYNKYTFKEKIKGMGPGILVVGTFLGPGSITSATRAGASFGYTLLWTVVFSIVAVIVLQEMASRFGIVTQTGLAEGIMSYLKDRPVLRKILATVIAVSITLGGMAYMGGDLTGTAMGVSTITGIPTNVVAAAWGCCILIIINIGDDVLKTLMKLLAVTVTIMAVVFTLTMIVSKPDLGEVFRGVIPTIPSGSALTCGAMIGTTVVPYNMFIHATSSRRTWSDPKQLPLSRFDTTITMIIGGFITAAIMISAGAVIRGIEVTSAADMAGSLDPLLGRFAKPFLCIGMIAAGVSASTGTPLGVSYVLAGLFGWEMSKKDKRFFFTNIIVVVTGIIVAATGYNPVSIIMTAQALNGIFLPIVVFLLIYLTSREKLMGKYKSTPIQNILGILVGIITLVVGISSVASFF
ncbi:MAG: Nramp family divalent metal transporter [Lachnospiraceae bacterium]